MSDRDNKPRTNTPLVTKSWASDSRQQKRRSITVAARREISDRFAQGEYSSNVPRAHRRLMASRLATRRFTGEE
jgi:hypothetical protein